MQLGHMRAFLFYGRNHVTSPLSRARDTDTAISIRSLKTVRPSLQLRIMLFRILSSSCLSNPANIRVRFESLGGTVSPRNADCLPA